jgi:hypothetical protein
MEHDAYSVRIHAAAGSRVDVELENIEAASAGNGLSKRIRLSQGESFLEVHYAIPEYKKTISVDFAFSPDYLNLLRHGRDLLKSFEEGRARGWSTDSIAVWVREEDNGEYSWSHPFPENDGHKACLRLATCCREFTVSIGVTRL